MNRPDEPTCKRLHDLWSRARRSSYPSEAVTARRMLAQMQAQLGLNDAEVGFMAEYEEKAPISSDDSEQPLNVFELLLHLFEERAIILNFCAGGCRRFLDSSLSVFAPFAYALLSNRRVRVANEGNFAIPRSPER
jgi:hypothetical protein